VTSPLDVSYGQWRFLSIRYISAHYFGFINRVFHGILGQFGGCCADEVNVEHLPQAQ